MRKWKRGRERQGKRKMGGKGARDMVSRWGHLDRWGGNNQDGGYRERRGTQSGMGCYSELLTIGPWAGKPSPTPSFFVRLFHVIVTTGTNYQRILERKLILHFRYSYSIRLREGHVDFSSRIIDHWCWVFNVFSMFDISCFISNCISIWPRNRESQ